MSRVLFIASKPFFPWRSSCIRMGHDLLTLGQLGYEVDFLTVPVGEHQPIPGVRIVKVPNLFFARNLPEGPSLRKFGFNVLLLAVAVVMVLRNRYAVVHGLDDAGVPAWIAGRLGRAAVVFEKHDDPGNLHRHSAWKRMLGRCYDKVECFVLRRVDAAIGAGPDLVPAMQAMGRGSRACRIPDIPSALDTPPPEHVAECRRRLVQHEDDILVAYVGSFATFQGLDLLFAAIPRVRAAESRVRFVIVGGTTGEICRQQRVLARLGLVDAVAFLGRVTPVELASVLAASDILVAPRLSGEHAPMKVLDYLKSGTAIVATDCPANRAVLTSEVAVLAPAEPQAFADGILALSRDPAQRHEFGRRGREFIKNAHSFEVFQDSLRRCYDYLAATRGA